MLEILQFILESYYRTIVVLFALFLITRIHLVKIQTTSSFEHLIKKITNNNED